MNIVDILRERARGGQYRVVLPDGEDERAQAAASRLVELDLASVLLLGRREKMVSAFEAAGRNPRLEVLDPRESRSIEPFAEKFVELRATRGKQITLEQAAETMRDPLHYGAMLLRLGEVTCSVAGSISSTANVLKAGIAVLGTAAGVKTVSSFFIVVLKGSTPEEVKLFADCAVLPRPTEEQLADIAIAAADNLKALFGLEPRVAMLSFSTRGSADHEDVHRVKRSTTMVRERRPDLLVDGELQFDAAFLPSVAARKAPDSAVAGKANVYIFPDLDAGNIGYKITERIGGAQVIGPIVQGLAKPYYDLSRGCSVEDIVNTATIGCIVGGGGRG
ncbi:MAG: phosphate acetyltransferase [Deltaproteobacteria bacterium RIFOXYA12_FULL_61_11]|nr:MAG: phosphate acetyltransferase [Deltaproteobacteria bacterium RIFOXYA12_FULL_61_11]